MWVLGVLGFLAVYAVMGWITVFCYSAYGASFTYDDYRVAGFAWPLFLFFGIGIALWDGAVYIWKRIPRSAVTALNPVEAGWKVNETVTEIPEKIAEKKEALAAKRKPHVLVHGNGEEDG